MKDETNINQRFSFETFVEGCCESEFDSTYPNILSGIIRQDEYKTSIDNINQHTPRPTSLFILIAVCSLICVAGVAVLIYGGISLVIPAIAAGAALLGIGLIACCVGCICIGLNSSGGLETAVAVESAKYNTRSPTPCVWELRTAGRYSGNDSIYSYQVRITAVD